jgi:polyisoprenoid-binding protein YceI
MATVNWALDPTHSEVEFKVRHLMISNVTGQFTKFNLEAQTEGEDFTTAKVKFTAEAGSVDTGNEQRDQHLRTGDFFEVEKFPTITFIPTKYVSVDNDGSYEISGNLTIRDVTKPVTMEIEFGGIVKDPWGNTRAGFTVTGKINRKEFGLQWHAVTETGGIMLSDEVRLHANFELIKKA